jgi:hypothetical protein
MSAATHPFESQARLWLVAFAVSALVNLVGLSAVAFWVIAKVALQVPSPETVATTESVATIVPEMIVPAQGAAAAPEAVPAAPPPPPPSYARTSPDQEEIAPERREYIGERNTRATSDATPMAESPDQISQKGREPIDEQEVETTQSNYQDGDLAHDRIKRDMKAEAEPAPPSPPAATTPPAPEPATASQPTEPQPPQKLDGIEPKVEEPPAEETKERLAEGSVPVERRVKEAKPEDQTKPGSPERKSEGQEAQPNSQQQQPQAVAQQPKPPAAASSPNAPGFRGNQKKTKLVGNITRSGRSALNVEDSILGRYHAAVSRAVEKEWQLNCVRNRDYITPGMLTMSFMLDAKGKVKEIRVVEDLQVGAIPKGFTLNAINDAEIPAMPADLKKQLNGEPLELLYRFSF